jgi:3-polyprenyl-4-hydroxybenzoate decarboxylase
MTQQPHAAPGDFQEHLARLEAKGLLVRIDRPICKDTEIHPLMRCQFLGNYAEADRRAMLFTNVHGAKGEKYDIPVVVGAKVSRTSGSGPSTTPSRRNLSRTRPVMK